MRPHIVWTMLSSLAMAFTEPSTTTTLSKRQDDEGARCYNWDEIIGFSALCPQTNWPIENNQGLNVMGVFYIAMVGTTLPDDTVYETGENIICTVSGKASNITVDIGAGAAYGPLSGGGSVSFDFSVGDNAGGICMFTESETDDHATPNITLAQARERLLDLITTPGLPCKTCGEIRIQPDNAATNSSNPTAILKIDYVQANNCFENCVGPNSFSETSATPSPSPSPSASESAASRDLPAGGQSTSAVFASAAMAWLIGVGVFTIATA